MNELISDNGKLLSAWNEWKAICSIEGCSSENREPLVRLVTAGFLKKLTCLVGLAEARELLAGSEEANLAVQQFDTGLIFKAKNPGVAKRTGKAKVAKIWKEFVWHKIDESSDPPLKVIHGELIGPRGAMSEIVEEFVAKNFSGELTKHRFAPMESISNEFEDKDGNRQNFEDFLVPAEETLSNEQESDLRMTLKKILDENFTAQEKACLLAKDAGIALTDRSLLDFCGFESSKANDMCNNAIKRLSDLLRGHFSRNECIVICTGILFSLLKEAVGAEKGSHKFLLNVNNHS